MTSILVATLSSEANPHKGVSVLANNLIRSFRWSTSSTFGLLCGLILRYTIFKIYIEKRSLQDWRSFIMFCKLLVFSKTTVNSLSSSNCSMSSFVMRIVLAFGAKQKSFSRWLRNNQTGRYRFFECRPA